MNSGNTIITFKNIDHSKVYDDYARKELARLDKFLEHERTPIKIELVIQSNPARNLHNIELKIQTPRFSLTSHDEGYDVFLAIDAAINKMLTEMRKEKEKRLDGREVNKRQIK